MQREARRWTVRPTTVFETAQANLLPTAAALQVAVHLRGRGGEPARSSLSTPAAMNCDSHARTALGPELEEEEARAGTRSAPTPDPQPSTSSSVRLRTVLVVPSERMRL